MPDLKLTKNHFENINNDMNNQVEMLSDAEVNAIASKINQVINLPVIKREEVELTIFCKLVKLVDKTLYRLLPNEYYVMVKNASDGISQEEVTRLEERLTPIVNSKIDIPILNEKQEGKVIGLILGIILNAMVKGMKLEEKEPE